VAGLGGDVGDRASLPEHERDEAAAQPVAAMITATSAAIRRRAAKPGAWRADCRPAMGLVADAWHSAPGLGYGVACWAEAVRGFGAVVVCAIAGVLLLVPPAFRPGRGARPGR
jgi:hypothetical protein